MSDQAAKLQGFSMETPTECQCDEPGYCGLMRRSMSEVRHSECKNKPGYFQVFLKESGKHDAQPPQPQLTWDWESGPCDNAGEVLRRVKCKPCSGRKTAEIRACRIHGECAWSHGIRKNGMSGPLVKSCRNCEDYKPPCAPTNPLVCRHRGDVTRTAEMKSGCPKCPSETVNVHGCDRHGECSVMAKGVRSADGKKLLKSCDRCEDFEGNPGKPKPNKKPGKNGSLKLIRKKKPNKKAKPTPKPPESKHVFLRDGSGKSAMNLEDSRLGQSAFLLLGGPSLAQEPVDLLTESGATIAAVNSAANLCTPQLWFMVDPPKAEFPARHWKNPAVKKFTLKSRKGDLVKTAENKSAGIRAKQCPQAFFIDYSCGFTAESFLTKPKPAWLAKWQDGRKNHEKKSVMLIAIRMLYWLGFRRVYLLGADFHYRPKRTYAFEGIDKKAGACGTNNTTMGVLRNWFEVLRPEFERRGFHVYNCTTGSRLTAFDFVDLETAVSDAIWNAETLDN